MERKAIRKWYQVESFLLLWLVLMHLNLYLSEQYQISVPNSIFFCGNIFLLLLCGSCILSLQKKYFFQNEQLVTDKKSLSLIILIAVLAVALIVL